MASLYSLFTTSDLPSIRLRLKLFYRKDFRVGFLVGPNCVGYMPLSSQNAYHIIVHSSANYGPHLINPLDKFNFRDRNFVKNRI